MIDVKQAVGNAVKFLGDMFGEHLRDVRLEEVERSEDGNLWFVTLSFVRFDGLADLAQSLAASLPREYKIFSVSVATGEVRSMKIRQLA